jgi:hypothetical protein
MDKLDPQLLGRSLELCLSVFLPQQFIGIRLP